MTVDATTKSVGVARTALDGEMNRLDCSVESLWTLTIFSYLINFTEMGADGSFKRKE
jgi:hypothetical protein